MLFLASSLLSVLVVLTSQQQWCCLSFSLLLHPVSRVSRTTTSFPTIYSPLSSRISLHSTGLRRTDAKDYGARMEPSSSSLSAKAAVSSNTTGSSTKSLASRFVKSVIMLLGCLLVKKKVSWASGMIVSQATAPASAATSVKGMIIWAILFTFTAIMHSAESAITKISPWKIQEFAEEEGPKSPFATLTTNLTSLLTTILLVTTTCSIYSTALFVASLSNLFPKLSLGFLSFSLTVITLFFGELVPKAVAVNNSEVVARLLVPMIHRFASLLMPLTKLITTLSDFVLLRVLGVKSHEETNVSEDMLRMVVDEAQRSENIDTAEGRMIKNVLNMQDREVERIMQPRVDIIALPETASAMEILQVATYTKYSRIPIYRGDIDNIIGIAFSKDLLDFIELPADFKGFGAQKSSHSRLDAAFKSKMDRSTGNSRGSKRSNRKNRNGRGASETLKVGNDVNDKSLGDEVEKLHRWYQITAKEMIETACFIPETMSCWDALQEMKKRRLHMAIVVDEYGGTAGLVTLEDILEEVVGEIYDEDDDKEEQRDDWTIFRHNQNMFSIKAYAEVADVFEALGINEDTIREYYKNTGNLQEEDDMIQAADEFSTIGGLLCSIAGRIPQEGDIIPFAGYSFFISKVENGRRIADILVEPIVRTDLLEAAVGSTAINLSSSTSVMTTKAISVKEAYADMLLESKLADHDFNISGDDIENVEEDLMQENERYKSPDSIAPSPSSATSTESSSSTNSNTAAGTIPIASSTSTSIKSGSTLIFQDGEWIDPKTL